MTIDELQRVMDKIQIGLFGMGDVERELAWAVYEAARKYKQAQEMILHGDVIPDTRLARSGQIDVC